MSRLTVVTTIIGLVVGAMWAITGLAGAALTLALALVGFVIGLALDGRIDVNFRRNKDEL